LQTSKGSPDGLRTRKAVTHQIALTDSSLKIAPQLNIDGKITLYTLDSNGVFHRCSSTAPFKTGQITYSVLKNGILIPKKGPYSIQFDVAANGDLVPTNSNNCIYKSDTASFYLKGIKKMLIPVEIYHSGNRVLYVFAGKHLLYSEPSKKSSKNNVGITENVKALNYNLIPDKSCSGDVTLFLLKSDGVFARNPPDEYLPNGMKLKYELREDGSLTPGMSKNVTPLQLTYLTGDNGNLNPCKSNTHSLTTMRETTKSYMLGEGGVLAPVSEVMGLNKSINYFYDGKLVHSSNQFKKMYSNATTVYLTENNKDYSQETEIDAVKPGPKFHCPLRRISKRDAENSRESERNEIPRNSKPLAVPELAFAYDDTGRRIHLEPLISDCGKIKLYKLTCKGHFKCLEPHKEPEYGFRVQFKLLLDSHILVPTHKNNGKILIKYTLLENGNLAPLKHQKNTFKKAPASVLYYVLAKNRELLPVRLNILKTNHIEVFYQDTLIHTISPEAAKGLEVFTTFYAPLYAYFRGRVTIIYAEEPSRKPCKGATWNNPNKSGEHIDYPCRNLYLVGPNKTKIKIALDLNENGVPVVYEMDCTGICHKSPKDNKKNMVLKSFKLLKEGILLPTNETNGYIYLIDKQGNMLPYCYPESKLRAPHGLTVKYVFCKEGVLLPVLVEALGDHIRFSYEKTVIYTKRAYSLEEILDLCENISHSDKEDDEYHREQDGSFVYFELKGNLFVRHPSHHIEDYLVSHCGYIKILPCGTLKPLAYPDPTCDTLKLQIEKNGDLLIISNTGKKPTDKDYLLGKNGDLIPVQIKKSDDIWKFYKDGVRVGTQRVSLWNINEATPSGRDPLKLLNDPAPKVEDCKEPHKIKIPIEVCKEHNNVKKEDCKKDHQPKVDDCKDDHKIKVEDCKHDQKPKVEDCKDDHKIKVDDCKDNHKVKGEDCKENQVKIPIEEPKSCKKEEKFDKKKCDQIRKTIKEIIAKDPSMHNMELEMSDSVMDELYNMVCECSKHKQKRDLESFFTIDDDENC